MGFWRFWSRYLGVLNTMANWVIEDSLLRMMWTLMKSERSTERSQQRQSWCQIGRRSDCELFTPAPLSCERRATYLSVHVGRREIPKCLPDDSRLVILIKAHLDVICKQQQQQNTTSDQRQLIRKKRTSLPHVHTCKFEYIAFFTSSMATNVCRTTGWMMVKITVRKMADFEVQQFH